MGDHWRSQDREAPIVQFRGDVSDAGREDEFVSLPPEAPAFDLRNDLGKLLTPLDLELLPLLESGLQVNEIAERLGIKPKTIANRLYAMRQRMKKYVA